MKILSLIGPTASGKNELVLKLLDAHPNLAIINMDSAQVYKELSIGSNKPNIQEQSICPHFLFDYISVSDSFDVNRYLQDLENALRTCFDRGLLPIIVGGTMMYAYQFLHGLVQVPFLCPTKIDQWRQSHCHLTTDQLYALLLKHDKDLARRIYQDDRQRIERGLCVLDLTGHRLSFYQQQPPRKSKFQPYFVKLNYECKQKHRDLIYQRMLKMIDMGLIEEVKDLYKNFSNSKYPFWRYVGYRQIRAHLEGESERSEMENQVFFATCQLAKRQKTWLKKLPGSTIYVDEPYSFDILKKLIVKEDIL